MSLGRLRKAPQSTIRWDVKQAICFRDQLRVNVKARKIWVIPECDFEHATHLLDIIFSKSS